VKKSDDSTKPKMFYGASSRLFEYARQNRSKGTPAERKLWEELRAKKNAGLKFRRQHPIGVFIVDFYCHQAKLAIELDGDYHLEEEQRLYDENRTKLLQEAGIHELRFKNEEVMEHVQKVVKTIFDAVQKQDILAHRIED
jgi:very-short-patch-repair endonuclease